MPFNHKGNTTNGNALGKLATKTTTLKGRVTNLPIYEVAWATISTNPIVGKNFVSVIAGIVADDEQDLIAGNRQPTNHDDRLGNLPVAPGGNVVYREYFLKGNAFSMPGFPRIVADIHSQRLFITPTHYDIYLTDFEAAKRAPENSEIAAKTKDAHNPFFLITGASAGNALFT